MEKSSQAQKEANAMKQQLKIMTLDKNEPVVSNSDIKFKPYFL